jgi:predicted nucleotidyltransferase
MEHFIVPEKFKIDVEKAIKILKEEGCNEIYIFGSIVRGDHNDNSDIDIAVNGLNPTQYFRILGKLMLELSVNIDLLDLDEENNRMANLLKEKGELYRVA